MFFCFSNVFDFVFCLETLNEPRLHLTERNTWSHRITREAPPPPAGWRVKHETLRHPSPPITTEPRRAWRGPGGGGGGGRRRRQEEEVEEEEEEAAAAMSRSDVKSMLHVLKLHSLSWPPGGSSGCIEVYIVTTSLSKHCQHEFMSQSLVSSLLLDSMMSSFILYGHLE